jgi:uncharacterized protein (TIGR02996 family)
MSAPLSDEDKAFVRAILNCPADLTGWLAYADWLDERDDPRAEFIRLVIRCGQLDYRDAEEWYRLQTRLQELRSTLDPSWVAIFDRPAVENCDKLPASKCPKKWENLNGTDDPFVRNCNTCGNHVYYCLTVAEVYRHTKKSNRVAVSPLVHRGPAGVANIVLNRMVRSSRQGTPTAPASKPWWKFW